MINVKKTMKGKKETVGKIRRILKSNKGSGVISYVIFVAFVILALILIQPEIRDVFTETAGTFKTWIGAKIASILQ